jgi:predicted dienelactone hydrolase
MRPLEFFLVALTAGAAIGLLIGHWKRIVSALVAVALLALPVHAIIEGMHWQMVPAYVAIGVVCLARWMQHKRQRRATIITACSALLFVALGVTFSILMPIFHLPTPTGRYPVGTSILYFKDSARSEDAASGKGSARELMVQIWYPAQPSHNRLARYRLLKETSLLSSYLSVVRTNSRQDAPLATENAPFQVILFNHGWNGMRTSDTFLTEELASHGYIVVSIDHTYNARQVAFPDGRVIQADAPNDVNAPETSTPDRVKAIWNKEMAKWVADQRFVLDRLQQMNLTAGSPWFRRINAKSTGSIGFSFGGAASTAVCAEDERVRAAVNMDGWFFGAIRQRGRNQPLLYIESYTGEESQSNQTNSTVVSILGSTDLADLKTSMRSFGGNWLSINGIVHEDLTDQPLISPLRILSHRGTLPAKRIHNIVRSYVLAFFDKTLRGEDPAILHPNIRPYDEAIFEEWPQR